METAETRVLKSSFSGIKGAKKERKLLEKSSTSYLGAGCREFESRHLDQKRRDGFCHLFFFRPWRDSKNEMQQSGGLLLAASWMAATH